MCTEKKHRDEQFPCFRFDSESEHRFTDCRSKFVALSQTLLVDLDGVNASWCAGVKFCKYVQRDAAPTREREPEPTDFTREPTARTNNLHMCVCVQPRGSRVLRVLTAQMCADELTTNQPNIYSFEQKFRGQDFFFEFRQIPVVWWGESCFLNDKCPEHMNVQLSRHSQLSWILLSFAWPWKHHTYREQNTPFPVRAGVRH